MGEEASQGITRRDLLRRGAVLGGAVVWTTPMVQTLGMGRAFAQTASPVGGKDISYIAINVDCGSSQFFVKYEDGSGWENDPGQAPHCAPKDDPVFDGLNGGSEGFDVKFLTESCAELSVPLEYRSCDLTIWVMGGTECNTVEYNGEAKITVCTPAS